MKKLKSQVWELGSQWGFWMQADVERCRRFSLWAKENGVPHSVNYTASGCETVDGLEIPRLDGKGLIFLDLATCHDGLRCPDYNIQGFWDLERQLGHKPELAPENEQ